MPTILRAPARRPRLPLSAVALVFLALVVLAPASARAQTASPWAPCSDLAGYECGTLSVPLDRSGAVPGTVTLATSRVVAAQNPSRTAVVTLAGGPGQAALPLREDFAKMLGAALSSRDLLVFDQRGTGLSGALTCSSLSSALSLVRAVNSCATALGSPRGFYRTADSVADIEALRQAYGYDKLVLFGVSYGTKVAEDYASAYPDRVEALVLDSVVLPEGPDVFRRSSLRASPRVLGSLCGRGACRGITSAVRTDLSRLASRLLRGPLRGTVVTSSGSRVRVSADQTSLARVLLAGDLNPTLRAELPGSMRAALTGDTAPFLRLAQRGASLANGSQAAAQSDSAALYLATTCEEAPFPWARGAGVEQRWTEATRAALSTPKSQRGPFSTRTMLDASVAPLCLGWPNAAPAPAANGALPDVPTLVFSGQMDLRTPLEDATQIRNRIPAARLVEIPYAGHSVLSTDSSTCAAAAVSAFFSGAEPSRCPVKSNPYAPTPKPPSSLKRLRPLGPGGNSGRAARAARMTIVDARRQVIGEAMAQDQLPNAIGGLRAGTVAPRVAGETLIMRLRGYSYVKGVALSGSWSSTAGGTLTVRGTVNGRVTISRRGAIRGTLGGHRIDVGPTAGAAAAGDRPIGDDGLPSIDAALATGRVRAGS